VKRNALIKDLVKSGCYLKRHGSKHDIYANPKNGKQAPVPRHSDIKESLVRLIKKQLLP
jgi:predicted RNA binding protein YcfA (HicA-like mRNA interferase family)